MFLEASAGTGKTEKIQGILVERVLDQSLSIDAALERTLLVSFTDAAAAELRTRIQGTLSHVIQAIRGAVRFRSDVLATAVAAAPGTDDDKVIRLTGAQAAIDRLAVGTIHSFCKQLINRYPIECRARTGLVIVSDLADIAQEAVADAYAELVQLYSSHGLWEQGFDKSRGFPGNTLKTQTPEKLLLLAKHVVASDLQIEPPQQPPLLIGGQPTQDYATIRNWFAHQIRRRIEWRKRRLGLLSLSDLVRTIDIALREPQSALAATITGSWDLIILDEAQDTDAAQWRILQRVAGPQGRFIAVGDPKQSIFSFRGAHYHSLPPLQSGSPWRTDRATLTRNYRSDAPLLNSLNTFFGNGAVPQFTAVNPVHGCRLHRGAAAAANEASGLYFHLARPSGPGSFEVDHAYDAVAEAMRLELEAGLEIKDDKGGQRPVGPGDVAVLVRGNWSAEMMRRALVRRGIPVAAASRASILESDELRELAAVFAAIAAPFDHRRVTAAAMTSIVGFDNVGVNRMRREGDASAERQKLIEQLAALRQTLLLEGVGPVLERIFDDPWPPTGLSARERILGEPDGERTMKNLLDIAALLVQEFWRPGGSAASEAVAHWLLNASARSSARELVEDDTGGFGVALETDSDAVRIMTVHAAKGRQFGIVWLPDVCSSFTGTKYYDWGQPWNMVHRGEVMLEPSADPAQARPQAITEQIEEELRLLYVAGTRAHHRTHMVVGCFDLPDKLPRLAIGNLLAQRPPADSNANPPAFCHRGAEARLMAELQRIKATAAQHDGVVVIEDLPPVTQHRLAAATIVTPPAPPPPLAVPAPMRLSSFSSLKSLASVPDQPGSSIPWHAAGPEDEAEFEGGGEDEEILRLRLPNEDEQEDEDFGEPDTGHAAGGPGAGMTPLTIPHSVLPGSRASGDLVHRVLESIVPVLDNLTVADVATVIGKVADEKGLAADSEVRTKLAGPLLQALSQQLGGPLFGSLSLLDLSQHGTATAEVPFTVGLDLESPKAKADLHAVFKDHGHGDFEGFADELKPLKAVEGRGLLTGKIDLVWRCWRTGSVGLIDYKTNTLRIGLEEGLEAYRHDLLAHEMKSARYLLQAALYAAVVDAWLRRIDPAWDYERMFGGVSFPFLRAMGPHHDGKPDNAVFHVQVPKDLARGLAAALRIDLRGAMAAAGKAIAS